MPAVSLHQRGVWWDQTHSYFHWGKELYRVPRGPGSIYIRLTDGTLLRPFDLEMVDGPIGSIDVPDADYIALVNPEGNTLDAEVVQSVRNDDVYSYLLWEGHWFRINRHDLNVFVRLPKTLETKEMILDLAGGVGRSYPGILQWFYIPNVERLKDVSGENISSAEAVEE